jgi:hypothetical protein
MANNTGTIVLGFGHRARQGKDEAVRAIIEARGEQFDIRRYPFAGELKREINEAAERAGGMLGLFTNPLIYLETELPEWVKYEADPDMSDPLCPLGKQRTLLQFWGGHKRNEDPFYWVRKVAERIAADKPQFALIPDMRYVNEAFWVKANTGYTVKVTRHGFSDLSTNPEHISERQLANFAFDISITVLDGELEQLRKDAVQVFDMVIEWNTPPDLTTEDFIPMESEESVQAAA